MAQYTQISQAEMEAHLNVHPELGTPIIPGGFHRISIEGTNEIVYAKIVKPNVSLRIYSSIVAGAVRGNGEDAIRVCLFWRKSKDDKPVMIGTSKRVHRVLGWKKNLNERINKWVDMLGPNCKLCDSPTVYRTKHKFFGCSMYPQCKGSA